MPKEKKKEKVGRPSKYNDQTVQKVADYMECWESLGDIIPSIAGLAVYLKVSRDSIHTWRNEEGKEEFSDMLDELLANQEKILISKGLDSSFNSTIAKLALTKHGYSDRQDIAHNVEGVTFNMDYGKNEAD